MCELLGMSANVPTDICFSFTGLLKHTGNHGQHNDGWGMTFYDGHGCRSFHDDLPGSQSRLGDLLSQYPIKSHIVVSHIRQANRGRVCIENTHPFSRELWGRYWTFAHNGQLKGIKKQKLQFYRPVGTTDSEYTFCWILDQIRLKFPEKPRQVRKLWIFVESLFENLAQNGVFNVLMSDSQVLYAYCSTRLTTITRRAPFGKAELKDADLSVDFAAMTTLSDVVTIIATEKLTEEPLWNIMKKGDFCIFNNGEQCYPCVLP
jgi:predicted glutamine amidotransferase